MSDKLKIFMGLSVLSIAASLYQIVTKMPSASSAFFIIYGILVVLFNRDKAISKDKVARLVVIVTLVLLLVVAFVTR